MKKNKTIAYALAATLLVGGTFAGTKAWFTDKDESKSDLILTTGSIDVELKSRGWNVVGETEATETNNDGVFTNVRPGDKFEKAVEVNNLGDLKQILNVKGGEDKDDQDMFKITTSAQTDIGVDRELEPGTGTGFYVYVEVLGDKMGNGFQERTFDLESAMEPIVVDAKQVNDKTK